MNNTPSFSLSPKLQNLYDSLVEPRKLYVKCLIIIALLLYFFPVIDPDTTWHIKTGEYIVKNQSLPEQDPFSYTAENDRRTSFILKQYWLAQIIYYFFYKVGGWWGIIALRLIIYLSIILLFIRFSKNLNIYLRVSLTGFLIFSLSHYVADRPVALTLLFFTITIYLIEREKYFPVPFVMLLWANCHGGFITGDFLLFLYSIDRIRQKQYKNALLLFSGIVMSLANPNLWGAFVEFIFGNTEYYKLIGEYRSPINIFIDRGTKTIVYFGLALGGIFLLLIPRIVKLRLAEIICISIFLLFSFKHLRATPFISIFLSFISVKYFISYYNEKIPDKLLRVDCVALAVIIFISGLLAWDKRHPVAFSPIFTPPTLTIFFEEARPKPNIYNHYDIGGFLIFALPSDYKVFVDPRGISFKAIEDGREIEAVSKNMELILKKHNVNVIVVWVMDPFVRVLAPLLVNLLSREDWKLVFLDGAVAVFIKDIPEHSEIIKKYNIEKDNILKTIVITCGMFIYSEPNNSYFYFLLGRTYEKLEMYEKAVEAIKVGLEIKKDKDAESMLKRIEQKLSNSR